MNEDEAVTWLAASGVSRETIDRLDAFRAMVIAENARQNLISAGSIQHFWTRHIVDSAQLLQFTASPTPSEGEEWLDLGTGAGFPGMVIAILRRAPITFVESRRRRVEFLRAAATHLALDYVDVAQCQLEAFRGGSYDVISARAFAPLARLFPLANGFSTAKTRWLLPKGRSAHAELESIAESWQGVFHVKQSVSDPAASIIVATDVRPRAR